MFYPSFLHIIKKRICYCELINKIKGVKFWHSTALEGRGIDLILLVRVSWIIGLRMGEKKWKIHLQ